MTDNNQAIVIDNGSGIFKAGFAEDESPRCVLPSVCGHLSFAKSPLSKEAKDFYVGYEAIANSGLLCLKHPVKNGIVTNWDYMEKILSYTFNIELHIDQTEHSFIFTDPSRNPKANREMMAQFMFESFSVPSLCFANQGLLSLHASGRTTGIVCEIGDSITQIVPIYENCYLKHAIIRKNIGGSDITNYFQDLLNDQGYYFESSSEKEIVCDIKERHARVALDYDADVLKALKQPDEIHYTLPDGKVCSFASESFKCTELLFKPILNGFKFDGIHDLLFDSIQKCDIDVRKDLYPNIILSGGTTMFDGFPERIENEIIKLAPKMKVKVVANPERKYAAWIGGSILGSLNEFPQILINRDDYNENGSQIVHNNCL